MPTLPPNADHRRAEAERLIQIARRMLDRPEDEIVVNYLDHAIEALHILAEEAQSGMA